MSTFKLKVIQVNIYKGKYLTDLIDFFKVQNPDFITMQEGSEGSLNLSSGFNGNIFHELGRLLKMEGACHFDLICDDGAKMGNIVLGKHKIMSSKVLPLFETDIYTRSKIDSMTNFENFPRHLIDAAYNFHGSKLHIASWHGAWTAPPQDTRETYRQARLVYNHLKGLNAPFILGGDLNAVLGSKTVNLISSVANNLMIDSGVRMTTNPAVHKIAPLGFMIDYIFTSHEFKLKSIDVPQITVSDHLPVVAELEIDL